VIVPVSGAARGIAAVSGAIGVGGGGASGILGASKDGAAVSRVGCATAGVARSAAIIGTIRRISGFLKRALGVRGI